VLLLILFVAWRFSRVSLSAYEDGSDIALEFKSLMKVKNIFQAVDNQHGLELFRVVPVGFDKNMKEVKIKSSVLVGDENYIENMQYARSGRVYIKKTDVDRYIRFNYKNFNVKYIKIYWGVADQFFPIRCEWDNNQVGKCMEEEKRSQ